MSPLSHPFNPSPHYLFFVSSSCILIVPSMVGVSCRTMHTTSIVMSAARKDWYQPFRVSLAVAIDNPFHFLFGILPPSAKLRAVGSCSIHLS
jgi:hypothetical protein